MAFRDRLARGELRLNRIEAFSDGVFAIVVTLLVLELTVPTLRDPRSVRELARHLVELLPKLLSWLISFVIVAKFWLNHHHVLGLARHADYAMVWINSTFLMSQSFIPFPTALMGQYPGNPLAVSFFGGVFALNTILFIALHAYILRRLLKPELAAAQDPDIIRKSLVGPLSYGCGAAAWLNVHIAFAIYALTPLFFIVPTPPPQAASSVATTD
jgi:uncharacterized membrane protein